MPRLGFVIFFSLVVGLIFSTCSGCAFAPLKGGSTKSVFGKDYTLLESGQPQNPAQATTQEATRTETKETPTATPSAETKEERKPDGTVVTTRTEFSPQIAKETVSVGTKSEVGAAQKDNGRELAAKLASMRPIQMIGVGLMVFAAAALYYTPLRILLGAGKQFPIVVGLIGLGLVVAPQILAGNEILVLIISAVAGLIYWLTIRLTRKEAEADVKKS